MATAVEHRSGIVVPPARRPRPHRLFDGALVVITAHLAVSAAALLLDGSFAAAVPLGLAALVPLARAGFVAGGRLARTALAGVAGLVATLAGLALHVTHAVLDEPTVADATGTLAAVAGVVLLAVAFRTALGGRRRLVQIALAIPVLLVLVQWAVVPAIGAGLAVHAGDGSIATAAGLGLPGARDVRFAAADGAPLTGWYMPGASGAAVVLLHGSHGTREDTGDHLRLLARAGFAVLAFDARGHGQSGGQANALGWRGDDDLAGAVAFLQGQPGVDPERIAALGLSMGGEEALRAAATGVPLRAVVADGAGGATLGDQRLVGHGLGAALRLSVAWVDLRAVELLSGDDEPAPLRDLVPRIEVPTLLIASHAADERELGEAYARRIGARASVWYVADAGHTATLDVHPEQYAARVSAFLQAALGPAPASG